MRSVPPRGSKGGSLVLVPGFCATVQNPPATEAVKKTFVLESALVRLARDEVTWGGMDRLRIGERCRQRAHKCAF